MVRRNRTAERCLLKTQHGPAAVPFDQRAGSLVTCLGLLTLLGDLGGLPGLAADMPLLEQNGRLLRLHVYNHRLKIVHPTVLLRVHAIESLVKLPCRFGLLRHIE